MQAGLPRVEASALLKASRFHRIVRWRRQNRRPVCCRRLFLDFQFGGKDGGRNGGNRDGTGLCATVTVENLGSVAGGDDFGEGGERGTDNVDAAYQFIGLAVGKDLVDHQRLDLKGLRLAATGQGKAA